MGDDGQSVDPTPMKRARTGDLKRVAEIVMVLSAMGEMRAGKDPTAVEKALAAEARERLAGICERELKPKDLISRDAVRVVVEDLGLNRSRDPMMGFRPTKMSIAEKLTLTKRKMEESKSFAPLSSVYSSQHAPVESHGTSMRQSPMGFSPGGYKSVSPGVHVPAVNPITPSLKQNVNETQLTTSPLKSSTSSLEKDSPSSAQHRAAAPHLRYDGQLNGSPYLTQVQAISTEKTPPVPPASSGPSTSAAHVKPIQPNNVVDHSLGKSDAQTRDQVARSSGANVSETPAAPGNPPIGHQLAGGSTFIQGPSFFTNHEDISKSVQKILQPKVFDHPNWNPPSAEYTNKPLNCQICKVPITDVESLLVCDACEKGTHLKCLQSFNKEGVPRAEWHCPRCLITSNGKPFPPKYGRVTRTIAPQKAPSNMVATSASSDKKPANLAAKVPQQRSVTNGNVGLPVHASNSLTNCSESSRDIKTTCTPDIQSGLKNEVELSTVTSTNNSTEKTGIVCALPSAKTESSEKDIKHSGSLARDMGRSAFEIQTHIKRGIAPSMVDPNNNSTGQAGLVSAPLNADAESYDKELKHNSSTNCSTEQTGVVFAPSSAKAESSDKEMKHSRSTNCSSKQVGVICAPLSAGVDSFDKVIKHSRSTDSSTAQDGICAPFNAEAEISDLDIKNSELPTSNMERSTFVSIVNPKVESEQSRTVNPVIKNTTQPQPPSESKEMQDPISVDVSANQQKEFISPRTDESKELFELQGESQHKTGCNVKQDVNVSANQRKEFMNPCTDESEEPDELQRASQQNTGWDINQDNSKVEVPNGNLNVNELRKPLKLKESSEYEANKNLLDSQDKYDATPNGLISNDGTSNWSIPLVESDAVHWLADVLKVTEDKTYYQSCQINGVLHKLQNHVLLSSSSQNIRPSKLQSLWEDNKTGSKWAIVNQYYFPGDLPQGPNLPSTSENNEVYASNKECTIMASSICGPCEVLSAQKFKEEIDRRRDANSGLHKVFLCRWMYDESMGFFQSISD